MSKSTICTANKTAFFWFGLVFCSFCVFPGFKGRLSAWVVTCTAHAFSCLKTQILLKIENICKKICIYKKKVLHLRQKFTNMADLDVKEYLRQVANKLPGEITAEDKAKVRELAAVYGVEVQTRGNCKQCYIDAAVIMWRKLAESAQAPTLSADPRRYVLRPGVDVYFGGQRINAATLSDKLAAAIIRRGFPLSFFAKYDNK